MAKDGTGPKRKALTEKISAGKTAEVIDLPGAVELTGVDMPPVKEYMKARQKNGDELCAEEIFAETWTWLKRVGCTELVNLQLINQYAMSVARQIQCEQAISECRIPSCRVLYLGEEFPCPGTLRLSMAA